MKYLTALTMAFLLSSCTGKPTPKPTSQSTAHTEYKNNVSLVSGVHPSAGEIASDFSWFDSNGKMISLRDLKGKTVLLNFWATWCGPCKAELPDIESLNKSYASRGLVVIGVSVDKGDNLLSDVSDFATSNGLTYQIVVDNDDIANAYGNINAIPTSFLVNRDGKIVDKWIGTRNKAFFESTVKKYLD